MIIPRPSASKQKVSQSQCCQAKMAVPSKIHKHFGDTWVAQLVERPTSAQVMISQSVGSSPTLGYVLTAQSQIGRASCRERV